MLQRLMTRNFWSPENIWDDIYTRKASFTGIGNVHRGGSQTPRNATECVHEAFENLTIFKVLRHITRPVLLIMEHALAGECLCLLRDKISRCYGEGVLQQYVGNAT